LAKNYRNGLRDFWEGGKRFPGVKPEANPIHTFLTAKYLGEEALVQDAIDNLRWFPLDMKWNRNTIQRYEKEFGFTYNPAPRSPKPAEGTPLPTDRRPKSWSAWVMDPYRSGGPRTVDVPIEYNGHDYLFGYWLGRYYGFIGAND